MHIGGGLGRLRDRRAGHAPLAQILLAADRAAPHEEPDPSLHATPPPRGPPPPPAATPPPQASSPHASPRVRLTWGHLLGIQGTRPFPPRPLKPRRPDPAAATSVTRPRSFVPSAPRVVSEAPDWQALRRSPAAPSGTTLAPPDLLLPTPEGQGSRRRPRPTGPARRRPEAQRHRHRPRPRHRRERGSVVDRWPPAEIGLNEHLAGNGIHAIETDLTETSSNSPTTPRGHPSSRRSIFSPAPRSVRSSPPPCRVSTRPSPATPANSPWQPRPTARAVPLGQVAIQLAPTSPSRRPALSSFRIQRAAAGCA